MSGLSGIFAALGSAVSWALGAVLFKKLGEKTPSIAMTAIKALSSAVMLLMLILIARINFFINIHDLIILSLSGVLGIAIGDSFFFASLKRLSPVVLSIILFAIPNIFYGTFGFIILKEMPSLQVWFGILLILTGLACILFPLKIKNTNEPKTTVIGVLFAIASILCTSISMVFIKPILQNTNSLVVTMYRALFGGLSLLLYGIIFKRNSTWMQPFLNKGYSLKFIGAVFIVTFGGFWLSLVAIKNCDVVLASTLMGLEPLFILLFIILFRKYKAELREYIGIFLALSGIISLMIYVG